MLLALAGRPESCCLSLILGFLHLQAISCSTIRHIQVRLAVSHVILPNIICSVLWHGSKTFQTPLVSPHFLSSPLQVVPPFSVATALQLSGAGHPCSLSLKPLSAIFQMAFPEIFPFYFLAALSSLHFIPVCWRVLRMQSNFCRLGPNCVSESTEAIFPCNKYTSRDA